MHGAREDGAVDHNPCAPTISVECMQASVGAEFDSIGCFQGCAWGVIQHGRTAFGWDTPPLGPCRRRGRADTVQTGSSLDMYILW